MATYANPKALKLIILFSNSIIFLINSIILIIIIIQLIGIGSPEAITESSYIPGSSDLDPITQNSTLPLRDILLVPTPVFRDENARRGNPDLIIQRFPSIASVSVKFLLLLSTISVAIVGSVAANSESPKLLNTNGYLCFLSFFVKYLFVIASLHMVGLSNSLHKLGFWLVFLLTTVGVYELVLGLSSCQFASTLKRGDAAEPQIQKLEFLKD